ncbi:hypothetical protein CC86DRAFT_184348 [Ophiobolus disseminans]|uniref:Uncharacterized protein n=1 Tax=Ophiobolus disseminans TaxID=1469910 RepID=A0A6A7A8D3_9PLEO|nr:hypothetical protein CC86DRAFT_184348 [Ophiobolus disseminans]
MATRSRFSTDTVSLPSSHSSSSMAEMVSLPSSLSPTGSSMQDIEIAQLKQEIEQLRVSEYTMKQQRDNARTEGFKIAGASAKYSRGVQALEQQLTELKKEVADLNVKLEVRDKELSQTRGKLASERTKRQMLPPPSLPSSSRHTTIIPDIRSKDAELRSTQAQLAQLQRDYAQLKDHAELNNLHAGADWESYKRECDERVEDAEQLTKAAEAETEGLRHIEDAYELLEIKDFETNKKLVELINECRQKDERVAWFEANANDQAAAHADLQEVIIDTYLASEAPELTCSSIYSVATKPQAPAPRLAISAVQSVSIAPQAKRACAPFAANVVINLSATDRKTWTLMQRVQSAICLKTRLDIHGPRNLTKDFIQGMAQVEADHAHWQNVALSSIEEMEEFRKRKLCTLPGHRNLADELVAKDLQLQIQQALILDWEREAAHWRAQMPQAVAKLQDKRASGKCSCNSAADPEP